MTNDQPIPAAQYLRMSTDHQQYSLDNQADAISRYAEVHGFIVVRTFSDEAKSGLSLNRRNGLKQLLKETVEGHPDFKAILVYDVSRWGRFQDADEAAHYEFMCKSSGAPVHYCAETFSDESGFSATIPSRGTLGLQPAKHVGPVSQDNASSTVSKILMQGVSFLSISYMRTIP